MYLNFNLQFLKVSFYFHNSINMVLPQIILYTFALITLLFGIVFVYYDIKSRSIDDYLFIAMSIFVIIELITFAIFQCSIILVILTIIIILTSIFSYHTGNIGLGDLPMIASILIFIFNINNALFYLIIFSIFFILSLLATPFVIYRNVLTKIEKIISFSLIIATIITFLIKLMFGIVIFFITMMFLSYIIVIKKDEFYKSAVRYMTKNELVIGDLIENKLLDQETRTKLGIIKQDGLTNINKEIMNKITDDMKLPIYSNSIPLTVPLFIGYVITLLFYSVL